MDIFMLRGHELQKQHACVWVSRAAYSESFPRIPASAGPRSIFAEVSLKSTGPEVRSIIAEMRMHPGLPDTACVIPDGCIAASGYADVVSRCWLQHCARAAPPCGLSLQSLPTAVAVPALKGRIQPLVASGTHEQMQWNGTTSLPVPLLHAPLPAGEEQSQQQDGALMPVPATHAELQQLPSTGSYRTVPSDDAVKALHLFFSRPRLLIAGQVLTLPLVKPGTAQQSQWQLSNAPWQRDAASQLHAADSICSQASSCTPAHVRFRVCSLHTATGLEQVACSPAGAWRASSVDGLQSDIVGAALAGAAFVGAEFTQLSLTQTPPSVPLHTPADELPWLLRPQASDMPKAAILTCDASCMEDLYQRIKHQRHSTICAPHCSGKRSIVAAAAAAAAVPCVDLHSADVLRAVQAASASTRGIIARISEALEALQTAALQRWGVCVVHLRSVHLLLLAAAADNTALTRRLGHTPLLEVSQSGNDAAVGTAQKAGGIVRGWLSAATAAAASKLLATGAASSVIDSAKQTPAVSDADEWEYFTSDDLAEAAAEAAPQQPETASTPDSMAKQITWVFSAAHPAVFEHWPATLLPVLLPRGQNTKTVTCAEGVQTVLRAWQKHTLGCSDEECAEPSPSESKLLCSLTCAQLDDCCVTALAACGHAESPATARDWYSALLCEAKKKLPLSATLQQQAADESEHDAFSMLAGWRAAAPGALGDSAASVAPTRWGDVGGADEAKAELHRLVTLPLLAAMPSTDGRQHVSRKPSLRMSGILLFGPPGTGKTLLAKAVAHECNVAFHSVKGPELLDKYIGESEANVRRVFQAARASAPCVVFFDELDALAPARGTGADSGGVSDRVVSALLAEMDACSQAQEAPVFVLGATNRPDLLDSALLRPGRFDRRVYVGPLDTPTAQREVLEAQLAHLQVDDDVTVDSILALLPQVCTGADIRGLLSRAGTLALQRTAQALEAALAASRAVPGNTSAAWPRASNAQAWAFARGLSHSQVTPRVALADLRIAAAALVCSVSPQDLLKYQRMRDSMASVSLSKPRTS